MNGKSDIPITALEERVKKILDSNDKLTVELGGLSEASFSTYKKLFERDYEVMGVANILNDGRTNVVNYILQIRKK